MILGRHRIEFDRYGRGDAGERAEAPRPERTVTGKTAPARADLPGERDWRSAGLDPRWLNPARSRAAVV